MRRSLLASLLVTVPFASCVCDVEPLTMPPGSVAGVACLPESGLPAAGVVIELRLDIGALHETADHDGAFRFDDVPAGDATLLLPGDRRERVVVRSSDTFIIDDEACRAPPDDAFGSVAGRVCNRHVDEVVAGARVSILLPGGVVLDDTTDADGRFSFSSVPVGSHVLSVTASGFSRAEEITVTEGVETDVDVGGACAVSPPLGLGGVRGRVCAPDGSGWLVDARASITPGGEDEIFQLTNVEGRFLLEGLPAGLQTLVISKGSFVSTRTVAVPPGDILELPEEECALVPDGLRIAVVRGSLYDHVEQVLDDVGVDPADIDMFDGDWAEQLLGADERVRDYRILFLNCRSAEPAYVASAAMQQRLRDFVADGGSLHASDQAYDLIEVTWPDAVDFYGDDAVRGSGDRGAIANALPALVVHAGLIAGLGRADATLRYALETWSVMVSAGTGVEVYLTADSALMDGAVVTGSPQIVGFNHGDGRVVYSSFHQEPGSHHDQLQILRLLMFEL